MKTDYGRERLDGFIEELRESFWGDWQRKSQEVLKELLEADPEHQMEEYLRLKWHEQPEQVLQTRLWNAAGSDPVAGRHQPKRTV